jgi:hypothetical protein
LPPYHTLPERLLTIKLCTEPCLRQYGYGRCPLHLVRRDKPRVFFGGDVVAPSLLMYSLMRGALVPPEGHVSWQKSIPRCANRSYTFRNDSGI